MPGRLPMRADQVNRKPVSPGCPDRLERGLGELLAEQVVDAEELVRPGILERQHARAERRVERPRPEIEEARPRGLAGSLELDERGVDAVGARPGDEADDTAGGDRPERRRPRQRDTA